MMKLQIKNLKKDFSDILKEKKLRNTKQRHLILQIFYSIDKHLSIDELYTIAKKINPKIGYATVHRTMKLFSKLGIAENIKISNQKVLYEHKYAHKHHDHLICTICGKFIEIMSEELENLQEKIAKVYNFEIINHNLIIYGICESCK